MLNDLQPMRLFDIIEIIMVKYYRQVPFFYTGDAARLLHVDRSTVWRWIDGDKIEGEQIGANQYWIISLDAINKRRGELHLDPISIEDADYFWKYGKLPDEKE